MGVDGDEGWSDLTTLDIDPNAKPDVLHDLNDPALPFADSTFDEVHAYEVLEHIGRQGDWRGYFREFSEYYRILRPDGLFFASCPAIASRWLWGDPGHVRTIQFETLIFLNQSAYGQLGKTALTDYRHVWRGDFETVHHHEDDVWFRFVLRAIKPSRYAL